MAQDNEAPLGEFAMIARHFAPIAGAGGLGLTDDAARLRVPEGHELVATTDLLVADVHFFADDPPASIARKALGVNLSDLAGKAATPLGFLLGFARPGLLPDSWIAAFAKGLGEAAAEWGCPLLGGDTVRPKAEAVSLAITAFGAVPEGRMPLRQGGAPGDVLVVTGTIGDAALGLRLQLEPEADWARTLSAESRAHLLDRYRHPRPRLGMAAALRDHASAAMDLSDGLVADAAKLGARFGRRFRLEEVPLSAAVAEAISLDGSLLDVALTGGDDYEVLAAVPPAHLMDFLESALAGGVPATPIGELGAPGPRTAWFEAEGSEHVFARAGYDHFGGQGT